jgi:hypothetical protein
MARMAFLPRLSSAHDTRRALATVRRRVMYLFHKIPFGVKNLHRFRAFAYTGSRPE